LTSFVVTAASARVGEVTRSAKIYAVSLVTALMTAVALLYSAGTGLEGEPWVIGALCFVALLAERQSVHITPNAQVSVSVLPLLFAAVVYGPFAAMIVGAFAMLADFGRPFTRWVVWTTSRSLVGGLAGVVAAIAIPADASFTRLLVGVAVTALTESSADMCFVALTAIAREKPVPDAVRAMGQVAAITVPLYTPVIAVLAYSYAELSPWTVLLFFVPAVAAQRLFILYQEQRRLADDLVAANDRLEAASLSFASALVAALDARDQYTAGHSAAVAVYARDIATRLDLSEHERRLAHLAGLVHDIGKVGLPPGLLEKPGPLTLDERRTMEQHSAIGERILSNVTGYADIAKIVRHHHERIDGNGYPDGIRGTDIPLISKILAVADAYNAMTSGRPYRDAMPSRVARFRLAQAVGTQFDTTVVAAFEAILATAADAYLSGQSANFAVEAQRQPSLQPKLAANVA
jgi:putative nucleotidyltransferase with HDIG domain